MSSKVHRGDHGLMLIPRSTAMKCINQMNGVLPQKYVRAEVTIIMAEPQALAWIHALENNTFPQGRSNLCAKDTYCCLGVEQRVNYGAVETSENSTTPVGVPASTASQNGDFSGYPTGNYLELTKKMYFDQSGDASRNPSLLIDDEWSSAVDANDEDHLSFPEIAVLVRKHIAVYTPLPQDLVRFDAS